MSGGYREHGVLLPERKESVRTEPPRQEGAMVARARTRTRQRRRRGTPRPDGVSWRERVGAKPFSEPGISRNAPLRWL